MNRNIFRGKRIFSRQIVILLTAYFIGLSSCEVSSKNHPVTKKTPVPNFDEKLAYSQILLYEKFGPKVPGTPGHRRAGDWIISELKAAGLHANEQRTMVRTFDHHLIPVRNIIAQTNPSAKIRYLLSAHWDSRPFCDEDPEKKYKNTPTPGINDGGSGVVVLLGVAKALQNMGNLPFGVDFLFLDAEDWGTPADDSSYSLGAQYWVKHPDPDGYRAKFGINFDMVGRTGSLFPAEPNSVRGAPGVANEIRAAASKLGYSAYFPRLNVGAVTDDHLFLMTLGFPVYDFVGIMRNGIFPPEWHTHFDTSRVISPIVLKVVGSTTLQVLWEDQDSK